MKFDVTVWEAVAGISPALQPREAANSFSIAVCN
jgi:hypothetical protein